MHRDQSNRGIKNSNGFDRAADCNLKSDNSLCALPWLALSSLIMRWLLPGLVICLLSACAGGAHGPGIAPPGAPGASGAGKTADITNDPSRERRATTVSVLAMAMRRMHELYVDPFPLDRLAVTGLNGLGEIDAAASARLEGQHVLVLWDGMAVDRLAVPQRFSTPESWAALMARSIHILQRQSRRLARADSEDLVQAMLGAMTAPMDRASRYVGPGHATSDRALRHGYVGIGIFIAGPDSADKVTREAATGGATGAAMEAGTGVEADWPVVARVLPRSPAERAGLAKGDRLVAVNGLAVSGMGPGEVERILRGRAGTSLRLAILPQGSALADMGLREILLKRDIVLPETVAARREGDTGWLSIHRFSRATASHLREAIARLDADGPIPVRGFVLDLRGNPGGLLDQAVSAADVFISSGRISATAGRHPDSFQRYHAAPDDAGLERPLVALIDGRTASAAEIVAAALQDSGRAVLVGTVSYGKGSVQTVTRLPNDGELYLTWSRLYAPSGYSFDRQGILPAVCTSAPGDGGDPELEDIVARLRNGVADMPGEIASLRSLAEYQDDTRDTLREICPARSHKGDRIEEEIARILLAEDQLYFTALRGSGAPLMALSGDPWQRLPAAISP